MIIAFTFTCFCLLHYNCMIEEVQSPGGLNKENMAAISSWVSKVSACQPDMITEDILETQPLLLNSDQTSGTLCQEKQSMPNSAVKSIQPSSLEKPCRPSNAKKAMRSSNTDKSSTPGSIKKWGRQLDLKMSSSPQRLHKSSYLDKLHKKRSLKKSHKLTNACKLASQPNSSSSERQIIPPWLAILQTSSMLSSQSCSSASQSQIVPVEPSRIKKPNPSCGCHDLKEPVSTEKAALHKHSSAKTCRHYNEKCLICNTPEFLLNDPLGTNKEHAENPHGSRDMNSSSKSFYETDYMYSGTEFNSYQDNESNDTMKTYDSEDSNAEIVIICDTSNNEDGMTRNTSHY
ncbi:Gm7073 [Phodopus roborovskii]|uniref:Gm7073 protein n=2 Tax=Phodopus roborovskii TaxID=109678 RepID=A0AAU9Z0E0_PHORO|nr:Gm7073 [Phodopus roborovskii]